MSKYFALLLISVAVPFILSFYPKLKFYKNLSSLLRSIGLIVIIYGAWDVFAAWRGHWSFNPQGICGIKIINLPVEEWFFFMVIPFCCIFTWEVLKYLRFSKEL